MKRQFWILPAMLLSLLISSPRAEAVTELKIGLLAPEGSTWSKLMNDMNEALKKRTGGQVALKFYFGTQGDESDMIRKMKINQLQGAGLTGKGLGELAPAIRLLELPFLFDNSAQIDQVRQAMLPVFTGELDKKGYALLGWADAGWVYLFSNHPIKTQADLKGRKMWLYAGDPVAEALYVQLGITPVTLTLPEVFTALQTGMVDTVYVPPLAALALQWYTKVKYITDFPIVNATGALVVNKAALAKLTPDQQKAVREVIGEYSKKLEEATRKENAEALTTLKNAGLQLLEVSPADKQTLTADGVAVWPKLVGKLYTQDELNKVKSIVGK